MQDAKDKKFMEELFFGTVTVGERGQIVIPAEARRAYEIETGDKLLVMGHPQKHGVLLCKVDSIREFMEMMLEGLKFVERHAINESNGAKPDETAHIV
jgi:AbrB family looped-hinge helix DNA binding protein